MTRTGWTLLIGSAVLGAAGARLDYPELLLLAAGGLIAVVLAAAWVWRPLPRLTTVRAWRPTEPQAGDTITVTATVTNVGSRRSARVRAEDRFAGSSYAMALPSIAPGARHTVAYDIPAVRRGTVTLAATSIGRADPLGLLRAGRPIGTDDRLRIHPRWHRGLAPVLDTGSDTERGVHAAVVVRGDVAFHSLREYRPGDAYRTIHWRSTAKLGVPMVRHQPVPDEPQQVLILDTAASAYPPDDFEEAVTIAASLVAAVRDLGLALTIRTTGDDPPVALSRVNRLPGDRTSAFDLLCDVGQDTVGRGLPTVLRELASGTEGSVLGVVTGTLSAVAAAAIANVRPMYHAAYVIQVGGSPPAVRLPDVRHLRVASSAEFARVWRTETAP
jgi:uncharacterized protein (DUF58 family)